MKKYSLIILILLISVPAYANDWSEDWVQRHYDRAYQKSLEYTRNPVKRVWRKIVLWDAENAIKIQDVTNEAMERYEANRPSTDYYDYILMQNAINNAANNMRDSFRPIQPVNYGPHYGTINGPHVGETYSFTLY